jgi:lipopolysaccharide assembly protein A
MQAVVWILRFFVIAVLVWFALKNHGEVSVFGFPGQEWKAPLVFVMLVAFVAGVVIGLLAWIPTVVRQRREIARLKRAGEQQAAVAALVPPASTPSAAVAADATGSGIHGV